MAARDNSWHAASAETAPVSTRVVNAVAAAEEVEPHELTPTLYAVIDPDALDSLFAPTGASPRINGHLSFEYAGHTVRVTATGNVTVDLEDTPVDQTA